MANILANRNNFIRWNRRYLKTQSSIDLSTLSGAVVASDSAGFDFADSGRELFVTDLVDNGIIHYSLSSAYDLSTLSYENFFATTATTPSEDFPFGIRVSNDGVSVDHVGIDNTRIFFAEMTTPYNISTYDELGNSPISVDNNPRDLKFINSSYYLVGQQNKRVYNNYTGSPDFFTIAETSTPIGIDFTSDGKKMFILGESEATIYEYDLPSPFDIENAILNTSYYTGLTNPSSLSFENGSFYVLSGTTLYELEAPSYERVAVPYGNEKQFDEISSCAVNLLNQDLISFYANIDLDDSSNFSSWRLDLLNSQGDTIVFDVATLSKDIISGSSFRFYVEDLEVPEVLPGGYYFAVRVDQNTLYESNMFKISTISPYALKVRFRNNVNILNFNYETLTSFKNEFRLRLVKRQGSPVANRIGYDLINGNFNPVRTTTGIKLKFVTDFYSLLDHEAWNSAIIQDLEIYNDETGTWESFTLPDGGVIEIEYEKNYPLGTGQVTLEQDNTYNSNKNV